MDVDRLLLVWKMEKSSILLNLSKNHNIKCLLCWKNIYVLKRLFFYFFIFIKTCSFLIKGKTSKKYFVSSNFLINWILILNYLLLLKVIMLQIIWRLFYGTWIIDQYILRKGSVDHERGKQARYMEFIKFPAVFVARSGCYSIWHFLHKNTFTNHDLLIRTNDLQIGKINSFLSNRL